MLELITEDGNVVLRHAGRHGKKYTFNLSAMSGLAQSATLNYLQPAVSYYNGRELHTQVSTLHKLIQFGGTMVEVGWTDLPNDDISWQSGIVKLYSHWLTRPVKSSLKSRVTDWNSALLPYLNILRDVEDVIPLSVVFPRAKKTVSQEDLKNYYDHFIGESQADDEPGNVEKLIASISITRTDAQYLDEVRDQLSHRRQVLDDACREWWKQIQHHFDYGQKLIEKTGKKALFEQIDSGKIREYRYDSKPIGTYHIASGGTEKSLGNLLTILKEKHASVVTKKLLGDSPELPHLSRIKFPPTIPGIVSDYVMPMQRLNWMLGNLLPIDVGFALIYLTLHCPKFTPTSLVEMLIVDKQGHPYLEVGDSGQHLRSDKRWAHKMKEELLDDAALSLVELILAMTSNVRKNLKQQGSSLANNLFFVADRGEIRPARIGMAAIVTGTKDRQSDRNMCLTTMFPNAREAGLGPNTVSLRKVRATEGVLEWFRTGSVAAMARKLGNSTSASIDHYLPKPLLRAWNIRQIRRFQNLWIVVATSTNDYQLQATDFTSLDELTDFLLNMLELHPAGSSPLADELHKRTKLRLNAVNDEPYSAHARLSVAVNVQTLTWLYLYRETALRSGIPAASLKKANVGSRIAPCTLIEMAELLRFRAQDDKRPEIRAAHKKAVEDLPGLLEQTKWDDLFVSWGN